MWEIRMIDLQLLRNDPEGIEKRLKTKLPEVEVKTVLDYDALVRSKKTEVEQLKARRNEASQAIGLLKREGKDASELLKEMESLPQKIHALDKEIQETELLLQDAWARLPNIPLEDVPVSLDKNDNVPIRVFKEKPTFSFPFKNHLELNETLQLFDFKRAAKLAGSGFPMYRNFGARLEWALIQYMVDFHMKNGFVQWIPPIVVKKEALFAAGQLPKFANQQYGVVDEEDGERLYLIPTAEVSLNGLHMDEILPEAVLPLKYIAYTPCFRREAGAAGANERGLIRVHQFNKVEMFAFAKPEDSSKVFEDMVRSAERILEGLELHFRTMLLVTGDMSYASTKTCDVEVWLPGQDRYYEVSSISNCTDYQSRRGLIRFRREGSKKPELVHTLNGSGLATSRLMVAIVENNQQEDGSIIIPKVLRPYLDGRERIYPAKKEEIF
jgi:seryl-tRNA synthetase